MGDVGVNLSTPHINSVTADAGFGTTGGFGTSAFGATTNAGGLFGSTQNKPGLSFTLIVCTFCLPHERLVSACLWLLIAAFGCLSKSFLNAQLVTCNQRYQIDVVK